MITSEMTEVTLPLYSRNQKRQYGELRVGVKILRGKVSTFTAAPEQVNYSIG